MITYSKSSKFSCSHDIVHFSKFRETTQFESKLQNSHEFFLEKYKKGEIKVPPHHFGANKYEKGGDFYYVHSGN